jgi:hypothetical protein
MALAQTARLKNEPEPALQRPSPLLRRPCACGGTPGVDGECAACKGKRLARAATAAPAAAPVALSPGPGHAFERVAVGAAPTHGSRPANAPAVDTTELPVDGDDADPEAELLQAPAGGGAAAAPPAPPAGTVVNAVATNTSCCRWASFEKSNDSYIDTATDSRKNVKFTYAVNFVETDSDPHKCVMVNWVKGTAKNKDGSFRRATLFGRTQDINFPAWRIDSVDADPVYWSNTTARWNYRPEGTGYFATDSPGPRVWVDGMDSDLQFKMCLYCIDDVSATSSETGSGVRNPLKCIDWVFKAKYDAASGTFTH